MTEIFSSRNIFIFTIFIIIFLGSCGAKKNTVLRSSNERNSYENTTKNTKTLNQKYANILETDENLLNKNLYITIDDWIGSKHQMGGMTKSGIDCSGFVTIVHQKVYNTNLPRISKEMAKSIHEKKRSKLKEGDLVFFSFEGKSIDHVGIYLHNDKFVHVSTKSGVIISNLNDVWYTKYYTTGGTPNQ